ncbi:ATPase [Microbacterium koreense]|uniref:ATPase n=1 Tax=Microbacterium koreense TaxID=323761 RepID=A0ABW2ZTI8_9MICO
MKKFACFLLGIAGGFVLAHLVNKDPRGHDLLSEVDSRITEFTDRIGDAYREQESRLTEIVDDARDVATQAAQDAKDAAAEAVDAASRTLSD